MWQDYVIATAVFGLTLTTIPMVLTGTRLPRLTTIPMVVCTAVLIVAYATLSLWTSVAVEVIAFSLWMILLHRSLHESA